MDNKIFLYARVSSKEQNENRQVDALVEYCKNNNIEFNERDIFIDKASGKDIERQQYKLLKHCLRSGDTIMIKELDRLSRRKADIKKELDYFKEHKIRIKILNIPTTLVDLPAEQSWVFDMVNNILIEVMGAIAEDEHNRILERQREGIEAYKRRNDGKGAGRPAITFPPLWEIYYTQWKSKSITAKECMDYLQLKRNSFYKLVKLYEEKKDSI